MSGPVRADIVVRTGAGISEKSGFDTPRDADGSWAEARLDGLSAH